MQRFIKFRRREVRSSAAERIGVSITCIWSLSDWFILEWIVMVILLCFIIFRQKAWSITKEREVAEALLHSKLQRYFLAWMGWYRASIINIFEVEID